ncbi:hypothetical protein DPSP01_012140 [Paraphaeosphaeria sporulosa]
MCVLPTFAKGLAAVAPSINNTACTVSNEYLFVQQEPAVPHRRPWTGENTFTWRDISADIAVPMSPCDESVKQVMQMYRTRTIGSVSRYTIQSQALEYGTSALEEEVAIEMIPEDRSDSFKEEEKWERVDSGDTSNDEERHERTKYAGTDCTRSTYMGKAGYSHTVLPKDESSNDSHVGGIQVIITEHFYQQN